MVEAPAPEEVRLWLEWGGSKLLALGISSPAPKSPHVVWPEYKTLASDAYGRTNNTLRPASPTRFEITLMDEILLLPGLIPDVLTRRIIHARALVTPVSNRYVYSWSKIATLLQSDRKAIALRHAKGLRSIVARLPPEKASALRHSFTALTR